MSLSSSPQQHTIVRVEARKSFAFAVEIFDAAGNLIDLTDCALSLVVAKQPHRGGTVVLDVLAEMLENGQGRAQFLLQAADLDLVPGEYPFALVLITADEYSAVVAKGVFDVQGNVEADSANFTYDATQPAQTLTARILKDNKVQVRVDHLPYPALRIGSVQTVENYEDAGASIEGVYPLQLLHLTLPKGGQGDKGDAPTIDIGTVSVAGPGLPADATMSGSALQRKLNLVLPQPEAYPVVAVPTEDGYAINSPVITDNGDGTVDVDLTDTIHVAHAQHRHPLTEIDELDPLLEQIGDSIDAIRAKVPDWEEGKTYPAESVVAHSGYLWRAKSAASGEPKLAIPRPPSLINAAPRYRIFTERLDTFELPLPGGILAGDLVVLIQSATYGGVNPGYLIEATGGGLDAEDWTTHTLLESTSVTHVVMSARATETTSGATLSLALQSSHRGAFGVYVLRGVTEISDSYTNLSISQQQVNWPTVPALDGEQMLLLLNTWGSSSTTASQGAIELAGSAAEDFSLEEVGTHFAGSYRGRHAAWTAQGPTAGGAITIDWTTSSAGRRAGYTGLVLRGQPGEESDWEVLETDAGLGARVATELTRVRSVARTSADSLTDIKPRLGDLEGLVVNGTTSTRGLLELATDTEVANGTDTSRAVTPKSLKQETDKIRARVPVWEEGKAYPADSVVQHNGWVWRTPVETDPLDSPAFPVPTLPSLRSSALATMSASLTHSVQLPSDIENGDHIFLILSLYSGGGTITAPADFIKLNSRTYYKVVTDAAAERGRVFTLSFSEAPTTVWSGSQRAVLVMRDVTEVGPYRSFATFQSPLDQPLEAFSDQAVALLYMAHTGGTPTVFSEPWEKQVTTGAAGVSFLLPGPYAGGNYTMSNGGSTFWGGSTVILTGLPPRESAWLPLVELGAQPNPAGWPWSKLLGVPATFPPSDHDAARITSGTVAAARLPAATESAIGAAERATLTEVATGTDTTRYVSPAGVRQETDKVRTELTALIDNTVIPITRADYDALPTPRPTDVVYVFKD